MAFRLGAVGGCLVVAHPSSALLWTLRPAVVSCPLSSSLLLLETES